MRKTIEEDDQRGMYNGKTVRKKRLWIVTTFPVRENALDTILGNLRNE
jgi:hypothetical protein